jgi:hypothetical protein
MVQRPPSSGESMSYVIKRLSNNIFNDFISHVDYFEGDLNYGDLYLAYVNNFISTKPATFKGVFVEYIKGEVSVVKYYDTIKKYLNPNLPVLLVGTNPFSQEVEIIQ